MRYRLLYDLDASSAAQPCGVIVERVDCVEVIAPADKAFRRRNAEPIDGPCYEDFSYATYMPGDPAYFDLVCLDLSRSFALVGEFEVAEPESAVSPS